MRVGCPPSTFPVGPHKLLLCGLSLTLTFTQPVLPTGAHIRTIRPQTTCSRSVLTNFLWFRTPSRTVAPCGIDARQAPICGSLTLCLPPAVRTLCRLFVPQPHFRPVVWRHWHVGGQFWRTGHAPHIASATSVLPVMQPVQNPSFFITLVNRVQTGFLSYKANGSLWQNTPPPHEAVV